MVKRAAGLANGGGVSSTSSTTAKIDAPAQSVSDSVRMAAAALAGERRSVRATCRRSRRTGGVYCLFACWPSTPAIPFDPRAVRAANGPRRGFNPPLPFVHNLLFLALPADTGPALPSALRDGRRKEKSRGARHHIFSAIAMNLADEVRRIVAEDPSALNRRQSRNENHRMLRSTRARPTPTAG